MAALLDRFREFLSKHCLTDASEKIVLAVSGGEDSMVMLHLFHQAGFSCEVAHCNFQLRGDEADADEELVRQMAAQYHFPFHVNRFLTEEFAIANSISIQMAARQLRYDWFDDLIEKYRFHAVAVAHHANDVAETMLLNLTKGTGIAGMHGIRAVHGNVIRPLLFATKNELDAYAAHNNIKWRTDASNFEVYYQRNKIRHEVIPLLEQINPDFTGAMMRHAKLMTGYEALLQNYFSQMENKIVHHSNEGRITSISFEALQASPAPAILLFHFLKPYGVNGILCDEILASSTVGAEFYSSGFKMVRDREALTIFDPTLLTDEEFELYETGNELKLPFGMLTIAALNLDSGINIQSLPGFTDGQIAYVDGASVRFPLTVRKWRQGDSFHPLGMKGRKLLSDFFIDSKFSSAMKEVVYLLMSEGEVVWVIGHRIDDRFKLGKTTKKSLRFSYIPNENKQGYTTTL